jgi:hypothetical protein
VFYSSWHKHLEKFQILSKPCILKAFKISSKKHLKRLGDGKGLDYLCRRFRRKREKLS